MEQRYNIRQATGIWQPITEVKRRVEEASPASARTVEIERASLQDHLRWMTEAGFDHAECFWHDGRRALMGAFRD
jgi:hypothetical protein